jgi:hypothetical protein
MFIIDVLLVVNVVAIGIALGLAGIAYAGMILDSFKE